MRTPLGALPFYKKGNVTRVGFGFAGREKETVAVTKNGTTIGQQTRVVTRFFKWKGTEKTDVKTTEGSSHFSYKFGQLMGIKAWRASATSKESLSSNRIHSMKSSAVGGKNRLRAGEYTYASASSKVTALYKCKGSVTVGQSVRESPWTKTLNLKLKRLQR